MYQQCGQSNASSNDNSLDPTQEIRGLKYILKFVSGKFSTAVNFERVVTIVEIKGLKFIYFSAEMVTSPILSTVIRFGGL
mmetsp:Transcript_19885/g.55206  ORF Transcript_19885/g.55206 Transcript_19885/m.55206 type:complete len:80 (+) Transcript_19885:308-547(+)